MPKMHIVVLLLIFTMFVEIQGWWLVGLLWIASTEREKCGGKVATFVTW